MEIILDKKLYGYCPGLERSIKLAEELSDRVNNLGHLIYCDVPLAHNAEVKSRMEKRGIHLVPHINEIKPKGDYFLVSAHGCSNQFQKELTERGFKVIDGICPKVKTVQDKAVSDYKDGYDIIIFGKPDHAETIGINGSINNQALIIKNLEGIGNLKLNKKTSLISQTTHSALEFDKLFKALVENNPGIEIVQRKTSCPIVSNRVSAVLDKIRQEKVDKVIIVGSPTSSNTKQLYNEVIKVVSGKMVADSRSIHPKDVSGSVKVLIASGTSAPPEIVEKVAKKIASFR